MIFSKFRGVKTLVFMQENVYKTLILKPKIKKTNRKKYFTFIYKIDFYSVLHSWITNTTVIFQASFLKKLFNV